MLELREYQRRSLDELVLYLRQAPRLGAKPAFVLQTGRPYREVPGLEDLPYVCLRVPTGGGKTLMACHALAIAAREYVQIDRTVCLWLVPSNAILEQTLAALRNRQHPYRQAVDAQFSGAVEVMTLAEALYVTPATLKGATVIIVSTLAALRVEDTDGRKIYESAGALMGHFADITPMQRAMLEQADGVIPFSLANVLRLRRPVVIMDEAHNARTALSFATLVRVTPSCVMEFTATPQTSHNPALGVLASNVLCHVSALELKEAEMIKLPIRLDTRGEWKEVVGAALAKQHELEAAATAEAADTGEYIRPIVLFQAQPRRANRATITADVVRQSLVDDFHIPAEQIKVATGSDWELDGVDLFAEVCPVRYVITVQALREGWDCSFAYVLCSVAEQYSARSVEQILGRILRMPNAKRKRREELNLSYAFAASTSFVTTAQSLKDALVENGFERMESEDLITQAAPVGLFDRSGLFDVDREAVSEEPNLRQLDPALRGRVNYDAVAGELSVRGGLTVGEARQLEETVSSPAGRAAVGRLVDRVRGAGPAPTAVASAPLLVPALAIRRDGQLRLFDGDELSEVEWDLAGCDTALAETEFPTRGPGGTTGEIDVGSAGRVEMTQFARQLHEQLSLFVEPGWTVPTLAIWLDRTISHHDIPQTQSRLFLHRALSGLIEGRGLTIDQIARAKFRVARSLETKIDGYRSACRRRAFQQLLFAPGAPVEVSPECVFRLTEDRYAPNWYYEGGFRFRKHAFRRIGELPSEGEEFECATFIDGLDEVEIWVKNISRRPETSFWLQTATDRFYPDFVARLADGRILVVEYKGADRFTNLDSEEKLAVGNLWEASSGGRCLFVMPTNRNFESIRAKIASRSRANSSTNFTP